MSNVQKIESTYPTLATKLFVQQLIMEYKVFNERPEMPYLWTRELSPIDSKILLSHACPAEEYAYYCKGLEQLLVGLEEYDSVIQSWLDKACYDKSQEIMRGDHIRTYNVNDYEGNAWAMNW